MPDPSSRTKWKVIFCERNKTCTASCLVNFLIHLLLHDLHYSQHRIMKLINVKLLITYKQNRIQSYKFSYRFLVNWFHFLLRIFQFWHQYLLQQIFHYQKNNTRMNSFPNRNREWWKVKTFSPLLSHRKMWTWAISQKSCPLFEPPAELTWPSRTWS